MTTADPDAPDAQVPPSSTALADADVRRRLEAYVRRRVPENDVEDVVQTVLCDALAVSARPGGADALWAWLVGIARHKIADRHRRAGRRRDVELEEVAVDPAPHDVRAMAEWAERQAAASPEGVRTLAWMAREGEGEKLEAIAAEERLPPARVRQRVSRMRRWMRERWRAEVAAVALIVVGILALRALLRSRNDGRDEASVAVPEPARAVDPDRAQATALRARAAEEAQRQAWSECLADLDAAARIDPAGDDAAPVVALRARAADAAHAADAAPPVAPKRAPKVAPVPAPKTKTTAPTAKPTSPMLDFRK